MYKSTHTFLIMVTIFNFFAMAIGIYVGNYKMAVVNFVSAMVTLSMVLINKYELFEFGYGKTFREALFNAYRNLFWFLVGKLPFITVTRKEN